jgi:hypothetical protein
MSDYGMLGMVTATPRGSSLTSDAAVSDTELLIDYSGDFDTDGGTLLLGALQLAYTGIVEGDAAEDPDTLLLAVALTVAASTDDPVGVVQGGQALYDYVAHVDMGLGDDVHVPLTYSQIVGWPVGIYDPPVPVMVSDDVLHLEDAPGRVPAGRTAFENTDAGTYSGAGDMLLLLTHTPLDGSTHIRQNGISLDPSEWFRSGFTVTIPDTGHFKLGDKFTAAYAYDGAAATEVTSGTETLPLSLVGTTTGNNNAATSVAVPGGATVGDFFVLMLAGVPVIGSGTVDCADSRVDGSIKTHVFNGAYWGRLDNLTNISITITGSKAAYALAVYSDAHTVTSSDSEASQTPNPMTAPPVTYHGNAIACFFTNIATGGTVTGPGIDADGDWTQDAVGVSTTAVCGVGIYSLSDSVGGTTPPGAVVEGTTLDRWDVVTIGVD